LEVAAVLLLEESAEGHGNEGVASGQGNVSNPDTTAAAPHSDRGSDQLKQYPSAVGYGFDGGTVLNQQCKQKQQQQQEQQQVEILAARGTGKDGCRSGTHGALQREEMCWGLGRAVALLAREPWLEGTGGEAGGQPGVRAVHGPLKQQQQQQQEAVGYGALRSVLDATRTRWQQGRWGRDPGGGPLMA
jgi:hypothetical protein